MRVRTAWKWNACQKNVFSASVCVSLSPISYLCTYFGAAQPKVRKQQEVLKIDQGDWPGIGGLVVPGGVFWCYHPGIVRWKAIFLQIWQQWGLDEGGEISGTACLSNAPAKSQRSTSHDWTGLRIQFPCMLVCWLPSMKISMAPLNCLRMISERVKQIPPRPCSHTLFNACYLLIAVHAGLPSSQNLVASNQP